MRKNLKKTLCVLLSLIMVLSAFAVTSSASSEGKITVTFDPANGASPKVFVIP